jgi:NAD(P)-dependent dehydrogenase (short-subunit alcohol dehydrogenase family)
LSNQHGKTFPVTGDDTGIGYVAAEQLARFAEPHDGLATRLRAQSEELTGVRPES